MKQNFLQQVILYRYRYIIGYILFLVVMAGLLLLELSSVPNGLTQREMDSAVYSATLHPEWTARVHDLPYHLLQKVSIWAFGLSAFAIKLPSVIFAFLSGIGLLLLLRRWFKQNVATISALLAISSSMFLIAGRTGTPDIMIIFWSVMLLLLGTLITQGAKYQFTWRLLIGVLVGLSLYTPLTVYVLAAAIIAGLLHPHARYTIRRFGGPEFIGAFFFFVIAIIPLCIGIYYQPRLVLDLIGLPEALPTSTEYGKSLIDLMSYIGGFMVPTITNVIQPAFNIATLVLIVLGIIRSFIDFHATRTYTLLIWGVVILPVLAFNPNNVSVLYVPAILFMAIGIQALIREWYSLFPRNPYARLAGLLPLIVLIGGVWYYNYNVYFSGFRYSQDTTSYFNQDLSLLHNSNVSDQDLVCMQVSDSMYSFYNILERTAHASNIAGDINASVSSPSNPNQTCNPTVIHADVAGSIDTELVSTFLVSDRSEDSLRWFILNR